MRFHPFFALFALAAHAASAQVPLPVPRPDSLATVIPAQPAADTLAAIHKLFAKRRRQQTAGGLGIVAAAAVGIALAQATSPASEKNSNSLGLGLLAIPVLAIELFAFDSFNLKNERLETKDFKAHKSSKWLKGKLKHVFSQ
ncbi:hypothetical protein ACFQ48_01880 [Hymenobacter caeli]|uniref:ABC-type nitrate/sulfonate/bicarbonate transport system permease component n=1 Tax=Hymenobacter caeli TaxID=2735894 RepID=A0ABX2FKU9_9BACT|nr:hypothetical protein [Hymenobacter caeli]NRT17572.1 ABC-type nitrate/sulfonate/bicarbonate transport system permease component [Hymenobacter caeli]